MSQDDGEGGDGVERGLDFCPSFPGDGKLGKIRSPVP